MAQEEQFYASTLLRSASQEIVNRGRSYFYAGRAIVIASSRFRSVVNVSGSDPKPYTVSIQWGEATGLIAKCTCAYASADIRLICAHKVAAALATEQHVVNHPEVSWRATMDKIVASLPSSSPRNSPIVVVFSLQNRFNRWAVQMYSIASSNFPTEQSFEYRDITSAIETLKLRGSAKLIKNALDLRRVVNNSDHVLSAIDLCQAYAGASNVSWQNGKLSIGRLIPALADCPLFEGTEEAPMRREINVLSEAASLQVSVDSTESDDGPGARLSALALLPNLQTIDLSDRGNHIVSSDPTWLLIEKSLVELKGPFNLIEPLMSAKELVIPGSEVGDLFSQYICALAPHLPVVGNVINWTSLSGKPSARLYLHLSEQGEAIADLKFAYGEDGFLVSGGSKQESEAVYIAKDQLFLRVSRDINAESYAEQALTATGMRKRPGHGDWGLRSTTNIISFVMNGIPSLVEAGFEIYGEEAVATAKINRNKPTMSVQVSSGIDWFDLKMGVTFGENGPTVSLADLRQAIKRKDRYVKLSDGSIGALPDDWIKRYSFLISLAEREGEDPSSQSLRLSRNHAILIEALLQDVENMGADQQYFDALQRLREFEKIIPRELPPSLEGIMRPYQKYGYDWLHFLREYGAGGCVADDMGLGKTIQVLAFLESLRLEKGVDRHPTLIILPRSLIFNWQREIERFTPGLSVFVHADQERPKDVRDFDGFDVVLTTYGILVRDIDLLRQRKFNCVVLDESQTIKNPMALSAKATRVLQCRQRIALTGTPVENSTLDLWSQFAFLNPGLLGSVTQFRNEFGASIDREQDEVKSEMLRKLVHPFILRRTKEQVAPDLPTRTERVVYTEMDTDQRDVYERTKKKFQTQLLGLIDAEGMSKARMKVLEGLLRLRQICNHPRLVDHEYQGESAKFIMLIDTLITLREEGHKALVFSQFVQMLKIVESELIKLDIPYEMLTGETRDRQERVDSFQQNADIPFFLLSLKAGGVGLNLTAADYVIHIDPWWNPAVELQATDRTHRIGQDKPVFIYKMIARGTVEDKILQLQERKKAVVSSVIASEGQFFKSLTRDDIAGLFD